MTTAYATATVHEIFKSLPCLGKMAAQAPQEGSKKCSPANRNTLAASTISSFHRLVGPAVTSQAEPAALNTLARLYL